MMNLRRPLTLLFVVIALACGEDPTEPGEDPVWSDFSGTFEGPWAIGSTGNDGYRCEAEAVVSVEAAGDSIEGSFSTGENHLGGRCEDWYSGGPFPASGKFRGVRTSEEEFEIQGFFDLSEDGLQGREDYEWEGEVVGDTLRMVGEVLFHGGFRVYGEFIGVVR